MKNIVLLGAPGAGKGTQAELIATEFNIPHISTGDILRNNIKTGTELGRLAKAFIDKGHLVPDEVVIDIVKARLNEDDAKDGYILDGFPRTIAQAIELDKIAKIDIAVNIDVPFETIISRLSGRRVCSCGETYHISMLGGATKCRKCGSELYVRDDDKPETVKSRLEVYEKQTAPLIAYYKNRGILADVEAKGAPQDIFCDIKAILK
ncbi:MAG: adenylate kinase [Clostridia bacterium]